MYIIGYQGTARLRSPAPGARGEAGLAEILASTALILACVFGNSPDFWLNVHRRTDLWEAMNSPRERKRIERARPLTAAA